MVDITATPLTSEAPGGSLRHAVVVVIGFGVVFVWVFAHPLVTGRLLAESDLFDSYLPLFLSPGLVWSSYEFAGVPAFADPENSAFYPVRWFFAHVIHSWNGFLISAYVLAACFTYAYLWSHTRSRAAAAFGATGFVLSESMLERVPHANILHAIVWVPLLLLSLDAMRVSRGWLLWLAVAVFAGACVVLAGHPQLAVYAAYLSAAYAVCGLIAEQAGVIQWLRVAAAAIVVALLSAVIAVPLLELSTYSVRQELGFTEFVDYANTPLQMLSALFPVITHSGLEAPTYVGLLALPLALVGATQVRTNWRIAFWLVVATVALMLGAGDSTLLARVAYGIPLYDRFRIVSRHLIFASFAINVLAAYGLAAVLGGRASRRVVLTAGAGFVAVIAGAAVLVARFPDGFRYDRVDETFPLPWLVDGIWVQLAVAALALSAFLAAWRVPRSKAVAPLLIVFLGVDLVRASSYDSTPYGLVMPTVDATAAMPGVHARHLASQLAGSRQRFLSFPDSLRDEVVPGMFARAWRMPSAGGYTSLLLQDVSAVGLVSANGRVQKAALTPVDLGLDLLSVKYVVARGPQLLPGELSDERWRQVNAFSTSRLTDRPGDADEAGESDYLVFENRHALPRAWLASEVVPTTDGVMADAIRTSRLPDGRQFDPRATALVFEGEVPGSRFEPGGTAEVTAIEDSRVSVAVTSPGGGFLVLSEAYYPGWQARINAGSAQPVHKTNVALQGVAVPAGRHVVTFEFAPRSRRLGLAMGTAGTVVLLAILLAGWRTVRA